MDDTTKKELQSAVFERLIQHLRERKDVQNLDLMNLAGFCRISQDLTVLALTRGLAEGGGGKPPRNWVGPNVLQERLAPGGAGGL